MRPGAGSSGTERRTGRILVVEDDIVTQKVAVAYLQHLGYAADVASDGVAALEILATRRYDAVLMDCHVPRLDGYQTTAEIRRREGSGPRTPIVAMTASEMAADREHCLSVGMDDHLAKPIHGDALAAVLRRWIASPPPAASLAAPAVAGLGPGGPAPAGSAWAGSAAAGSAPLGDDRVDEAALAELLEADADGVSGSSAILMLFVREASKALDRLREALAIGDFTEAAGIAHGVRGSAGTFGARRMGTAVADVETACRAADAATAAAALDAVGAEFDAFRSIVSARLIERAARPGLLSYPGAVG